MAALSFTLYYIITLDKHCAGFDIKMEDSSSSMLGQPPINKTSSNPVV